MSEVKTEIKKEDKPVSPSTQTPLPNQTPNTIDPYEGLTDEERRKIIAVKEFYATENTKSLLETYEQFGKNKADRDKLWNRFAEVAKRDSTLIFKGIVPPEMKTEEKKELDLTKIEDD